MTPLLSAGRLVLHQLDRLLDREGAAEVRSAVETILERLEGGEDDVLLEDELLDVLAERPEVRAFVSGLLRSDTVFRSRPLETADQRSMSDVGEPATTHVNAYVAAGGDPAPLRGPLVAGRAHEVFVALGAPRDESLLSAADAGFSLAAPLRDGVWLRAVLDLGDGSPPTTTPLYLQDNGESISCECAVGSAHDESCARRPWAVLPFTAPAQTARSLLVVYRGAVALHVQELTLPIGETQPPSSRLVWRILDDPRDLTDLDGRSASVVLSEDASHLLVNGLGFTGAPFSLPAGKADTAALSVRSLLHDIALVDERGKLRSRYDAQLSKPVDQLIDDLSRLARMGSKIFTTLFSPRHPDPTTPWSLPALLRHEALLRDRPPALQVVDPTFDDRSVVWQAVYDLPVGDDGSSLERCPSLEQLAEYAEQDAPPLCPHDEEHRGRDGVLCPWGFWGFSTRLEQPPDHPVPRAVPRERPPTCLLVRGPGLGPLDEEHAGRLRTTLGHKTVRSPSVTSREDLAAALSAEDLDVAYFYCHCGYVEQGAGAGVDRYLDLDGFQVTSSTIVSWARSPATWSRDHWRRRPPLVVLNGCHTSEFTTRSLGSFVPAFTVWGGAAGVIGTEVEVHQTLANHVAEGLLAALWTGKSVAEALRTVRWKLLSLGNVMGLAYTPHCRADLVLTTPSTDRGAPP